MRKSDVNPIASNPTNLNTLSHYIYAYIRGNGKLHNIFEKPHPADLGMRPITFTDGDPYGWLLVDFERLATVIRDTELLEARGGTQAATKALELGLHSLTIPELSEALEMALSLVLPPASRYSRPESNQACWDACMAALGRSLGEDRFVGLYRCPYVLRKTGIVANRTYELMSFFQACWMLSDKHLQCLPTALSMVVQACGSAFRDRERYPLSPVDDHGLSWTGSHVLFWKPEAQVSFEDYEIELNNGVVNVKSASLLDRIQRTDHEPEVVFGVPSETREFWGLRIAELPELTQVLRGLSVLPASVALGRAKKKEPEKQKTKKSTTKGVPQVVQLDFNAAEMDMKSRRDHLAVYIPCFWRKNEMYVRFPAAAEGIGGYGDMSEKFAQVGRRTWKDGVINVGLRSSAGDPIDSTHATLNVQVDYANLEKGAAIYHPNGVFVAASGLVSGAPFRELINQYTARYHRMIESGPFTQARAFVWFCEWLVHGEKLDFGELVMTKHLNIPTWLQAMVVPTHEGAVVLETYEKRSFFFKTLLMNRMTQPVYAFNPEAPGRAPFKNTVEEWLVSYGRYVISRMAAFCGYQLSDKVMRELLAYIFIPWTRPNGLMKAKVSQLVFDDIPRENKPLPEMPELAKEIYEMSGNDMPAWCMNPYGVLQNRYVRAS